MKLTFNLKGNLDFFVSNCDDDSEAKMTTWNEILIHGDPEGLKSFANLLQEIANIDQENINNQELPIGERVHIKLRPGIELSKSSDEVVVGRLDGKTSGEFNRRFFSKYD